MILLKDTRNPPLALITQKVIEKSLNEIKSPGLFQIAKKAVENGQWVFSMDISYWNRKILEELENETASTPGFIQTIMEICDTDEKPKEGLLLFKSEKTLLTFLEKTKVIELLDQNDYPHISVPALAALSYLRRTGFNERLFKKQEEALQKYGFIVTRSKKDKATITYQPKDNHRNYLRSKQKDQFVLGEKISCHDPKSPSAFEEAFIELEIKTEL